MVQVQPMPSLRPPPTPPPSAGAFNILNKVNMDVTQEALEKNVTEELQETAQEEARHQRAEWESQQKHAEVDGGNDSFDEDEFEDDAVLKSIQEKRLADMKSKASLERQFHAQGHGEYREIDESEFLKEVCASQWVVIHFYHPEFFRCKVVDKHMKIIAPKHLATKWLTINCDKAPFFVTKLGIQMLPTVIVFKDGVVKEQFSGFDEMGGRDEFRTEVMEKWLSEAGCIKVKKAVLARAVAPCSDDDDLSSCEEHDDEM